MKTPSQQRKTEQTKLKIPAEEGSKNGHDNETDQHGVSKVMENKTDITNNVNKSTTRFRANNSAITQNELPNVLANNTLEITQGNVSRTNVNNSRAKNFEGREKRDGTERPVGMVTSERARSENINEETNQDIGRQSLRTEEKLTSNEDFKETTTSESKNGESLKGEILTSLEDDNIGGDEKIDGQTQSEENLLINTNQGGKFEGNVENMDRRIEKLTNNGNSELGNAENIDGLSQNEGITKNKKIDGNRNRKETEKLRNRKENSEGIAEDEITNGKDLDKGNEKVNAFETTAAERDVPWSS